MVEPLLGGKLWTTLGHHLLIFYVERIWVQKSEPVHGQLITQRARGGKGQRMAALVLLARRKRNDIFIGNPLPPFRAQNKKGKENEKNNI